MTTFACGHDGPAGTYCKECEPVRSAPEEVQGFCLHVELWFNEGDKKIRCHVCLREWCLSKEYEAQTLPALAHQSRWMADHIVRRLNDRVRDLQNSPKP